MAISASRKLFFSVALTVILLLLAEGALSTLRALRSAARVSGMKEARHTEYDGELGWRNIPSFHNPSLYGEGRGYTTNEQGFRATRGNYAPEVPPGRYRIVCLGDSFTMGYGVDDADALPTQLEAVTPGVEAINMGMGGYGLGQGYLWYLRDGVQLEADLLLFSFIPHDFHRLIADEFLGVGKPVVAAKDGQIEVRNVPVPQGINTRLWASRLNRFSERLAIGSQLQSLIGQPASQAHEVAISADDFGPPAGSIFRRLAELSAERGQDFALVMLPVEWAVDPVVARWMTEFSKESGIPYIDMNRSFARLPDPERQAMFLPENKHLTEAGNRLAAEILRDELSALFPRYPRAESP